MPTALAQDASRLDDMLADSNRYRHMAVVLRRIANDLDELADVFMAAMKEGNDRV